MSESRIAIVEWSEEKQKKLPSSGVYSTVTKLFDDRNQEQAWSVVLELDSSDNQSSTPAKVRFLSPDAPWEKLKSGFSFELYEGFKKTARVRIV